jgi:DNA-binding CsgD family transcriptional regulator
VAENSDEAAAFVAMGVQGVIYRSINGPDVIDAMRRLARGETFVHVSNSVLNELGEDHVGLRVRDRLTAKELHIIATVVRGYKNREIAAELATTEQVVKNSLRAIFDKIGVSDRLELVLFVLHHRMLAHATATVRIDNDPPAAETEHHYRPIGRGDFSLHEALNHQGKRGCVAVVKPLGGLAVRPDR